ncbi:MAG: sigma 54-interacting transcriptional regulator [Desulfitobacteriaceae bacterium]|nr:sigma 54-interacting transcriptional regulator [Desulfitobacteriaceae bacterium]MDD4753849.1 sigma 54-interacting transcriptional regulator [Desulfitobacteriaceae bacterium]
MSQIAFLVVEESLMKIVNEFLEIKYPDIPVYQEIPDRFAELVKKLVGQGTQIIIARGGTAKSLRKLGLPITVVDIPVTGFDIIQVVEKARRYGRNIAVISTLDITKGIETLGPILDVDIRTYYIDQVGENETIVRNAFADGADVVIGGYATVEAAHKNNFSAELMLMTEEAIFQAVEEARRILHVQNQEKGRANLFRALLDYAYEGIVSVNSDNQILTFNPVAENILGVKTETVAGENISNVCPELDMEKVISQGKEEIGQILKVKDMDILCNKVAISVQGKVIGAVATFQEVSQIQMMEERVRKRFYADGHVANFTFNDIIGKNQAFQRIISMAKEYAITDFSVVILGESGTGKEVFAQSIHNYSKRRNGPFVAVNCAALPGQLLESELFGYVGGAFTGANQKGKPGLFEVAHEGTLLLDEIAEMDYQTQGKLLRVLQERQIMRLGSDKVIPINVRVLAATNKNLKKLVNEKLFRHDLYYRLNVLKLRIPPLREHPEDIQELAEKFLNNNYSIIKHNLRLSQEAIRELCRYKWPGNIRELQSIMERVIALHKQTVVDADTIRMLLAEEAEEEYIEDYDSNEAENIKQALALNGGNYSETARALGISRSTLWRKLKKLGLK